MNVDTIVNCIVGAVVTASLGATAYMFKHWLNEHLEYTKDFITSVRQLNEQHAQEVAANILELKDTLARDCLQRDAHLERHRLMSEEYDRIVDEVGSIRSDLTDIKKRVDALEDVERTRAAANMCK